jgi:hypothetical protein
MKVSYAFYRIQISSAVSKLFKFSQDLFFLNTLINITFCSNKRHKNWYSFVRFGNIFNYLTVLTLGCHKNWLVLLNLTFINLLMLCFISLRHVMLIYAFLFVIDFDYFVFASNKLITIGCCFNLCFLALMWCDKFDKLIDLAQTSQDFLFVDIYMIRILLRLLLSFFIRFQCSYYCRNYDS